MNKSLFIANLVRDPELRTTANGTSVCNFTAAVTDGFGDKKKVAYVPVTVWSKLGEACSVHLRKGSKVGVVGRLTTRSYEAKDGSKRTVLEVTADDVEFLTPKSETTAKQKTPAGFEPVDDIPTVFGDDSDDFEPMDDEQMPF